MASDGANGVKPTGGLSANDNIRRFAAPSRPLSPLPAHALFNEKTRCFVYGLQPRAVQGMLDFDFICKRKTPSVAGIIYTFGGQFVSKMYWGTSETLLPVYQQVAKAMAKHPDVDVVVNFASSRSVYSSTMELMEYPQIKTIAIIAEGVPERVSCLPPRAAGWRARDADQLSCSGPVRLRMSRRRRASRSLAPPRSVASSPAASRSATPAA
jgi:ATP citrate (pro-S)-lyase